MLVLRKLLRNRGCKELRGHQVPIAEEIEVGKKPVEKERLWEMLFQFLHLPEAIHPIFSHATSSCGIADCRVDET